MLGKIRKFIPHVFINYGKHLPLAILANFRYGFPGRKIKVVGVTGTDGKTTTVNMIYKILKDAGKKVSMVSTINAFISGKSYDTGFHVTSPDPEDVQKFLKSAVENGDEYMVLEVTSHALEQFRVWGIPFTVGVITNITHEHLDYHKTFDNYVRAKTKLVKIAKAAIINRDLMELGEFKNMGGKIITFPQNFPLKLKIPGKYNQENAQAAAVVGKVLGIEGKVIKKSLENFTGLPGRMEEIKNNKGIKIVVDFAHTPNALEQALKTLRAQTKGNIIAVFGAAGARDLQKRSMMGEISAKLADITILTDEDPRFEDRNEIINEIAVGAYRAGALDEKSLFKESDRAKAIKLAISLAERDDTVGIFGKGHEKSMNYQGKELPWSDVKTARQALGYDR